MVSTPLVCYHVLFFYFKICAGLSLFSGWINFNLFLKMSYYVSDIYNSLMLEENEHRYKFQLKLPVEEIDFNSTGEKFSSSKFVYFLTRDLSYSCTFFQWTFNNESFRIQRHWCAYYSASRRKKTKVENFISCWTFTWKT